MVVSEIGEQWSPQTAPAKHAEITITVADPVIPAFSNISSEIGINMPKVPQEVPVENASPSATRNMTAGSILVENPVSWIQFATNSPAPKWSLQSPPRVHANIKIIIEGTIALNP